MGFIVDLFTSNQANKAQQKAADKSIAASTDATDKTIALQREMFDKLWGGTQVQRDAGDAATRQMAALMGLSLPSQAAPQPAVTRPALTGSGGGQVQNYGNPYGSSPQMDTLQDGNALQPIGAQGQPMADPGTAGPQVLPGAAGDGAVTGNALATDPTAWLRSTPGYQFNFDEGMRSLNTGLASQGRLFSGDAGREAIRYGQNYGDRIYADQWNRLAGIAGAGQTAQSQGAQAGTNYANNTGNALMNNARNLSSSYQDKGNSSAGFWGNLQGSFNNTGNALSMFMGGF